MKDNPLLVLSFVFFLILFIKCAIFIEYTSIGRATRFPRHIFREWKIYAMYIGICGTIVSFIFLFKWKWWIVIFSAILDIWLIGNLIYWRSFNDLLSVWCLDAAGNLSGFWTSIFMFLEWKDFVFPILTILLVVVMICLPNKKQTKKLFFTICLPLSVLFTIPQVNYVYKELKLSLNPLHIKYAENWKPNRFHCYNFSPITYFFLQVRTWASVSAESKPQINEQDVLPFLCKSNNENVRKDYNLVVVLFESLETWTIHSEINNQPITPNLNKLCTSSHAFFADKVMKQTRAGQSSDAQLIINTGLLPIYNGVTCNRYWYNSYFSIANSLQRYRKQTYVVDNGFCWNQFKLTSMYGYDSSLVNNKTDYLMCKRISENIPDKPYILQIVTLASHVPFTAFADSSSLILPKNMPTDMANYIKSVNYTDKALGLLLDKVKNDSTIILVTGDHTIFYSEQRDKFRKYCNEHNLDIPMEKEFIPLIIYSPEIKNRVIVTDTVYQMDIYPTLLHLLHRENYIWQGLGMNLLNPEAKRKITPEAALKLSDAIIRNDYFQKLHKTTPPTEYQ